MSNNLFTYRFVVYFTLGMIMIFRSIWIIAIASYLAIAGCAPVAIVGGGAAGVLGHTLHCYGLGMVNNCPKPLPPETTAARNNDVETLRGLFESNPSLYKDSKSLNDILYQALISGSLDVIRFLVPKYADTNGYSEPRSAYTLFGMAGDKCQSLSLLLDMGAVPKQQQMRTGYFFRRVAQNAQGKNKEICLTTIKKIVAAGYAPTQEELDSAYKWAYEGWSGGDAVSERTGERNIEMSDLLRSLGAQYPSYTSKK
jgi:hypothetical protein